MFPRVSLSPNERSASLAADDDRIAEEFEQLLRRGAVVGNIQDRFAQAMQGWTEGVALTPGVMWSIEVAAKRVLHDYLAEGNLPVQSDHNELVNELRVTHDDQGHVTIELPQEVRRCLLLLTPSMISF